MRHCCFLDKTDHRRVTPRYKLLRGFHKVDLAVGTSEQLHWTFRTEDLSYIGIDYKPVLEASTVWFTVGHKTDCRLKHQSASASDGNCVTLHIKPSTAYRYAL
jgi:Fibronectin type III-like domain